MSWLQLKLKISSGTAEDLSDLLLLFGASSITYLDAKDQPLYEPKPDTTPLWDELWLTALFPEHIEINFIIKLLQKQHFIDADLDYQINTLEDQDWLNKWREYSKPTCFANRLWVVPSDYNNVVDETKQAVIRIDPGLAFGTGTHETSALCLEWLANYMTPGAKVIDYGCGSGILAIAAIKLGANKVWAIDNDPQALTATINNARANDISESQIIVQTPETNIASQADILIANILANPLIELAATFTRLIKDHGQIVLSGILTTQIATVTKKYLPTFVDFLRATKGDWALIWSTKKDLYD